MSKDLESPYEGGIPNWDALYRARGDEVSMTRPIFTGDVFTGVHLPGSTGRTKARSIVVLQHPCSMRTNGVDLAWQILVAEVSNRKEFDELGWTSRNFNLMPFPDVRPDVTTQARHQAADFDSLYTVAPALLTSRIASLSPFGVNLLLQRWVHYSSRVVVPTHDFQEQTAAFYEEADLNSENGTARENDRPRQGSRDPVGCRRRTTRDALQKFFFGWAPNHLSVNDPGGKSGDLSSYIPHMDRQGADQAGAVVGSRPRIQGARSRSTRRPCRGQAALEDCPRRRLSNQLSQRSSRPPRGSRRSGHQRDPSDTRGHGSALRQYDQGTCLRPDRSAVHAELAGEGRHTGTSGAGCSHSVHFLVREPCSRSFLWFRRRADQGVVRLPARSGSSQVP